MRTRSLLRTLFIIIGLCAWNNSHAQISSIKIEEADSLMALSAKPILILMSTDWCQYCLMQKQQIRKNNLFISQSSQFYFVEFDAERKDSVKFGGKIYHYKPTGVNIGTHELVLKLNRSPQITYPTWVLLDENFQPIFRHNGLLNNMQINELMFAISNSFPNNSH